MSDTLLQKLEKLADQALINCGKTQPSADKPAEYQWGYLQGKYAGLTMAVKEAAAFEEDEQTFNDNL